MWSSTEKSITFIANLVTILGFIAAAVGWLDLDILPKYVPPSKNVAIILICAFNIIACFGTMSFLKERTINNRPTVLAAFIITLGLCFSSAYLRDYFLGNLAELDKREAMQVAESVALASYFLCTMFLYVTSFIYPKGLTFGEWFKGSFRWRTYQGFGILLLLLAVYGGLSQYFGAANPTG